MQQVQQNSPEGTKLSVYSPRKAIIITLFAALGAGLVASLASVLTMLILRIAAGIPSPVELFGDHLLKLLPAPRFVDMLVFFSPHSKTTPLGLAMLGMIGLGTLLGLLYAAIVRIQLPAPGYRLAMREWLTALIFAVAMTAIATLLFWVEIAADVFASPGTIAGELLTSHLNPYNRSFSHTHYRSKRQSADLIG